MLTTSITLHRKSKDGTSVTILSTSVQYQVSASPTEKPETWYDDIKNAIQTDSKPYLWSKTTVTYSDNNQTITFSVSYKGKDGTNGTSFTPKGTATGFFYNMSSVPSYEDGMDSDVYIVNVDDRSNPTSKLPPYVCHFEYENFIIEHAEFGDGYNVKGHLYVANSNEWVDFGEIQGAKGDPGDPGIDAINIVFSPAELVFDAYENGNLKQAENSADVKVFRGNKQLTYLTDWYFPNVGGKQPGDNCKATFMVEGNNSPLKPIVKIYDISSTKIEGTNPQASVPASSGGINVPIKVNDVTYNAYLSFAVNVNTFAHTLIQDNKKYISKYTEISNKYNTVSNELNGKASKDELREVSSSIEQTAREISLSVSEKSIGRRNLLVGSAFRRQGEVSYIVDSHPYFIRMNDGYGGTNCAYMSKSGMTQNVWCGAMWNPVTVKPNTKYTFSMMLKVMSVCDERFDVQFIDVTYNSSNSVAFDTLAAADKMETFGWTLKKITITTPSLCTKLRIDAFIRRNGTAYMCRPMLEEGENYNGWTLSEQDYDYVGGNLLDNARTLDKSGTLITTNDTVIQNGYGTDSACAKSLMQANATLSDYKEVLKWIFGSTYLVNGNDYIFSFVAKADVDDARVVCYMWSGDIENSCDIFTEGNGGTWDSRSDGNIVFILSRQWTRYWVHWRPKDGYATPKEVIIRHTGNNSTSASTVYVTQPKLEIGATMTEWTERKTDLVDKASLKKAGIEITSDQVTLYGNKVQVKTPKENPSDGYDEAAMFQSGKLNAQFINAGDIVAEGINAQKITATKLNVTGDSKIGIWHITKVDGWGDIMQAEGTEYNGATVVSGIQYCPLFVRGGSPLTDYFRVGTSCTEFSYTSGNNAFRAVWFGNAARIVCKGSNNNMNLPTNYTYNTQYEPVQYIYSEQSKKDSPALAINVIAKGFTGTPTALQTNGAIQGVIAPNLRIMNYSGQISNSDCIVIVTKGGITLKLPAGPVVGQTLLIYSKVSSNVYIEYDSSGGYGTGKMYSNGSLQTKIEIGRAGTFTYFIFDGENWCYAYFNGSHRSV